MADDYLFHYTDAGAVIGMIRHRQLWASGHEYLNDGLEAELVPRRLRAMATEPNSHGTNRYTQKHRNAMVAHLRRGQGFYVASFSRRPDMLTQFRLYCPPRGGFAIGFPREYLSRLGELVPVIYETDAVNAWCIDFFSRYMQRAAEIDHDEMNELELQSRIENSHPWVTERSLKSITFKSDEFSTEEEVRILKHHCSATNFRPSRSGNVVVPYVEIDMPNEDVHVHVVPGPGPSQAVARNSIESMQRLCFKSETSWQMCYRSIKEFGYREL